MPIKPEHPIRDLGASSLLMTLALAGLLPACGGDDATGRDTESGSASVTITATDPSAGTDTGGSGTVGPGSATGTDSSDTEGTCAADKVCGDACCGTDEACVDGQCQVDCGDTPPCGPDQLCCDGGAGEICYAGQCVVPSGACSAAACATKIESDCPDGEICDPELGQCVPNFADPTCAFEPTPGVFDPVPRFTWGVRQDRDCSLGCQKEEQCDPGTNLCVPTWPHVSIAADDFPEFHQCVMTPMVADLDGDCIPEIIFNSYQNSNYTTNAILRVIRGDNGAKVWTLGDPEHRTDPGSHPAIGDLNGDGSPEIVVPGEGSDLIAVAADGTVLWHSDPYSFGGRSGSPSLANFDLQGDSEIAFGRAVWDSQGNLLFEGTGATGSNGSVGPLSCVADLDGDDRPELIVGGTVWTFTGTVGVDFAGQELWTGTPANGYCGVADFDLDGAPEVVTVNSNNITLFNGQDGTTLSQIAIAGGGAGGPPNIADFDGDGRPDIGTAGGNNYVVVQYLDGELVQLWQAETKDGSSQRTGSSVFDFDGDGRSEVIYGDEWHLRIYPGTEPDCPGGPNCDGVMTDEEVLFIDINSSRTRSENPIVADVDGDFKAEIIVSTNNESGQGAIGDAGIEVFEDRLDNWVSTLPIWNQHSYHVTNVRADGSIPSPEPANWSVPAGDPYNSYRRNTQGELDQLCAPDLVPNDLNIDPLQCPNLDISVKVLNEGCLGVGPGVDVAFYDGANLLGVVQTMNAIPAGGAVTVTLQVDDPGNAPFEITVVVDDDGMGNGQLNECREENNATEPFEVCEGIG